MLYKRLLVAVIVLTCWHTSFASYVEQLPKPVVGKQMTLDQTIKARRSVRKLSDQQISMQQLSQPQKSARA